MILMEFYILSFIKFPLSFYNKTQSTFILDCCIY